MIDFPRQDIEKKNIEFMKDISEFYRNSQNKEEIIYLLKNHLYPTGDGRIHLSLDSIHKSIIRKAWVLYQENKDNCFQFLELPILAQLQQIQRERKIDSHILEKVKNEVTPWLNKFILLKKPIPTPFDKKYILSSNRSLQNSYNYNLLIQKLKSVDLSEVDRKLISLHYYQILIEGPFEDRIDFLYALIFVYEGEIIIPGKNGGKAKRITEIEKILDDDFSLGWKKLGLIHYKLPYLAKCLDVKLRNDIAHLKYEIDNKGQVFLGDGTELKDIDDKITKLMHVIDSLPEIFLEPQIKEIRPAINEILENITRNSL